MYNLIVPLLCCAQGSMLGSTPGPSDQQQVVSQGSSTAGPQGKPILALKGQLMHWRLLVANTGQAPGARTILPSAACS